MGVTVFPAPSAASKWERTVHITSIQTWVVPADVTSVEVILCGGGGGGGYSGAGGSVIYRTLTVSPLSSHLITIGAGGAGALPGGNWSGSSGSSSSFGVLLSIAGGQGGTGNAFDLAQTSLGAGMGGHGGGDTTIVWQPAGNGGLGIMNYGGGGGGASRNSGTTGTAGGVGGFGGGKGSSWADAQTGSDGVANSGGGGGGTHPTNSGTGAGQHNGGSGVCIIKYWSAL